MRANNDIRVTKQVKQALAVSPNMNMQACLLQPVLTYKHIALGAKVANVHPALHAVYHACCSAG